MTWVTRTRPDFPTRQIVAPLPTRKHVLLLLGALIVTLCAALPQYLRARKSAQWPAVRGIIRVSLLKVGYLKSMKGYYGDVQYDYQVDGRTYRGTRLSFNRVHLAVEDAWQREIDQYPVGKTVAVYYDPQHPNIAVLEPGLLGEMKSLFRMVLGLIAFCCAAFVILLARGERESGTDTREFANQPPAKY